jgi:hypothetical protein
MQIFIDYSKYAGPKNLSLFSHNFWYMVYFTYSILSCDFLHDTSENVKSSVIVIFVFDCAQSFLKIYPCPNSHKDLSLFKSGCRHSFDMHWTCSSGAVALKGQAIRAVKFRLHRKELRI